MMRRAPMKRTAWPARAPLQKTEPKEPLSLTQQASNAIKSIPRKSTYAVVSREVCAAPITKSAPVRNEAYRRAVASLPCCICGVPGNSQAAHGSGAGTATCKGMGLKSCDLTCFPACVNCHRQLDQGALFKRAVRHELEPVWAADTQRKIQAMGLWPKGLPHLQDET